MRCVGFERRRARIMSSSALSCVTVLRCPFPLHIAIWEHARNREIKMRQCLWTRWLFSKGTCLMSSDHKTGKDPESNFSFGVRELRVANMAQEFGVNVAPLTVLNENRGV